MPRLSRWTIRLSFAYFIAGISMGSLMLANKGIHFESSIWRLLPVHIEILLFGWTVQLVLGTVFWIAPRFWVPPRRGNEAGAVAGIVLLNLGILLVIVGYGANLTLLIIFGRIAELGALASFVHHIWPRIVSRQG